MTYEFQGTSYHTTRNVLAAIADAWIWGGMNRPYPETLASNPRDLAADCVVGWEFGDTFAEWGVDVEMLAKQMADALIRAKMELAERDAE